MAVTLKVAALVPAVVPPPVICPENSMVSPALHHGAMRSRGCTSTYAPTAARMVAGSVSVSSISAVATREQHTDGLMASVGAPAHRAAALRLE